MTANHNAFQAAILQGIPTSLPPKHQFPAGVNRAPKRKDILSKEEKHLAIRNALRYFPKKWHAELAREFAEELQDYRTDLYVSFQTQLQIIRPTVIGLSCAVSTSSSTDADDSKQPGSSRGTAS